MTDARALRERVAEAIHDGLGGNGWAYANYGGDELVTEADKLAKAASAAIAIVLEEAARCADNAMSSNYSWNDACVEIAAAIRALATK